MGEIYCATFEYFSENRKAYVEACGNVSGTIEMKEGKMKESFRCVLFGSEATLTGRAKCCISFSFKAQS